MSLPNDLIIMMEGFPPLLLRRISVLQRVMLSLVLLLLSLLSEHKLLLSLLILELALY